MGRDDGCVAGWMGAWIVMHGHGGVWGDGSGDGWMARPKTEEKLGKNMMGAMVVCWWCAWHPHPARGGLFFAGSQVHQPMAVRLSPEKADCQFKPLALLAPHLPTRKQKRVRGHGMFGVFLECVVCVECLNEGANSTD